MSVDWTKPIEVVRDAVVCPARLSTEYSAIGRTVYEESGGPPWYVDEDGKIDGTPNYVRNCVVSETPTLRDQFAMAALQGILAGADRKMDADELARQAYLAADAMLAKRRH